MNKFPLIVSQRVSPIVSLLFSLSKPSTFQGKLKWLNTQTLNAMMIYPCHLLLYPRQHVIICHHSSSFGLPPLPLGWWRHLWTAPYWQPPQLFKLYISMFQWAEASSWHGITIFPKQPATRIKTHCVQKTNSSSHEALPSGQQGFAGQKACRTTLCLNQPQDIWPSSTFLDSCFRKWWILFHFFS